MRCSFAPLLKTITLMPPRQSGSKAPPAIVMSLSWLFETCGEMRPWYPSGISIATPVGTTALSCLATVTSIAANNVYPCSSWRHASSWIQASSVSISTFITCFSSMWIESILTGSLAAPSRRRQAMSAFTTSKRESSLCTLSTCRVKGYVPPYSPSRFSITFFRVLVFFFFPRSAS